MHGPTNVKKIIISGKRTDVFSIAFRAARVTVQIPLLRALDFRFGGQSGWSPKMKKLASIQCRRIMRGTTPPLPGTFPLIGTYWAQVKLFVFIILIIIQCHHHHTLKLPLCLLLVNVKMPYGTQNYFTLTVSVWMQNAVRNFEEKNVLRNKRTN